MKKPELTPEQAFRDAYADLALLAPDFDALLQRANGSLPGPGTGSGNSSGGWSADDAQPDRTDDEQAAMTRDEARALNGADIAERDVHDAMKALAAIRSNIATINRKLAPYRTKHRTFDPNDVPEDWCPNCYRRGNRQHSPTKHKKSGALEWSDAVCQWCGRFRAANGWLPTRKLVLRHHGTGNVTPTMIEAEYRQLPRSAKDAARTYLEDLPS